MAHSTSSAQATVFEASRNKQGQEVSEVERGMSSTALCEIQFQKNPGTTEIGVIAQEVQAQFPEIVNEDANGYLGVGYERLVPILIEAIKEQQKQIEALKKEVELLKNNNN